MTTFSDKPTLVGERVRLRPMVGGDAVHMLADSKDSEITHFTGTHDDFTAEQLEQWCSTRAAQENRLDLAAVDVSTGAWFGEVVISDWDPDNRSCSFRIALASTARDRGIGTEATRLIIDYVFQEISNPSVHRIELEVFDFNERARAVYEKLGFVAEGIARDALFWQGAFHDAITMSMLRTDR